MYSERPPRHQSQSYDYPAPFKMLNQATWSSDSLPLGRCGEYSSSTSIAGSVASSDRITIDLMLNPIQEPSTNTQSRITLPSIKTLDFHRYDLPPFDQLDLKTPSTAASYYYARPSTPKDYSPYQSALPPKDRHLSKIWKRGRRGSHSSSISCSVSPPSSPGSTYAAYEKYTPMSATITSCPMDPQEQTRHTAAYAYSQPQNCEYNYEKQQNSPAGYDSKATQGHSNKSYTLEEMHFIQYLREDKRMQWADIVGPFNAQFPAHKRERGALECRYYRLQLYPKVNEDGSFVFDDKGEIVMVNTKVRERRKRERTGGKGWDRLNEYFRLVSRCPEKVVEYEWTEEGDKRKARQIRKSKKVYQASFTT